MENKVTVNKEQKLYVIQSGNGYSCYGFDVLIKKRDALAEELGYPNLRKAGKGTMQAYNDYMTLVEIARKKYMDSNRSWRSSIELHPQLIGKEGKRVEVVTASGERSRFIVGKSTGWIPCHLEIKRRDSNGGDSVGTEPYQSVRIID